jgi:hypothetical protein
MFDLYVAPFLLQVFSDQTTMTMVRLVLAAKQATAVQPGAINIFNSSLSHQIQKFLGIESWFRKSAQDDKWSFCLTVGTLCPANQERP